MKLTFLLIVLFLVNAAALRAQPDQCALPLDQAPSFFNLKLGMSEDAVRDLFGTTIKFKPKKKAVQRTFFQNFIKRPSPAILPGVRALYLRFESHKVYQIEIFYENSSQWQTLDDFTNSVSVNHNLPIGAWVRNKNRAAATCNGFTIVADQVLNPRIELTDDAVNARLLALAAAAAAKQKQP